MAVPEKKRKKRTTKHIRSRPWVGKSAVGLIAFLGARSPQWQHAVALGVGRLLYWLPNAPRDITRRNLELCFTQLSDAEREELCKQSLYYLVRQALGMCHVWENRDEATQQVRQVYGLDAFQAAIEQGQSVILAAPHLGHWELLNAYVSKIQSGIGLYKAIRVEAVDKYVRDAREQYGSKFMEATPKSIRELLRALKKKTPVYILPDQEPTRPNGVHAQFYNHSAYTMTLVSKLAEKSDARVFGAFAQFTSEGVDIHFIEGDEAIKGDDAEAATALNGLVEACIAHCPEQYAWSYKRFRKQPDKKKLYA